MHDVLRRILPGQLVEVESSRLTPARAVRRKRSYDPRIVYLSYRPTNHEQSQQIRRMSYRGALVSPPGGVTVIANFPCSVVRFGTPLSIGPPAECCHVKERPGTTFAV